MCNRESFILLPKETGIPVAWSISYHHEIIGKHIRESGIPIKCHLYDPIQIECLGGNISKWDWDNTPTKIVMRAVSPLFQWKPMSPEDSIKPMEYSQTVEPDLPHWLEDNLQYYQNKVEDILEKINFLRDRQDRLWSYMIGGTPIDVVSRGIPDMEDVVKHAHKDSPEIMEFENIVNQYRLVGGFVHSKYNQQRQPVGILPAYKTRP